MTQIEQILQVMGHRAVTQRDLVAEMDFTPERLNSLIGLAVKRGLVRVVTRRRGLTQQVYQRADAAVVPVSETALHRWGYLGAGV